MTNFLSYYFTKHRAIRAIQKEKLLCKHFTDKNMELTFINQFSFFILYFKNIYSNAVDTSTICLDTDNNFL